MVKKKIRCRTQHNYNYLAQPAKLKPPKFSTNLPFLKLGESAAVQNFSNPTMVDWLNFFHSIRPIQPARSPAQNAV